jgi:hypothetical protein
MGDSFFAPQGSPLPPPEPDAPPPIAEDFAANVGLGLVKSGTFGSFLAGLIDALVAAFARIVGLVINLLASVFVAVIGVVGQMT